MYIFISHSSIDKPFVRQLAASLAYYGVPLFLDERDIKVGDNIPNKIYDALEKATHIIYVLSKSSITSNWVKEEFSIAKKKQLDKKGCLILPVLLDSIELPASIAHIKYADFRNWQVKESYLHAIQEVLVALDIKTEYVGPSELQMFRAHLPTLVTLKAMADAASQLYFQLERIFFVPPYNSIDAISYWYAETIDKTWSIDSWQDAYKVLEGKSLKLGSKAKNVDKVIKLCKLIEDDYVYFYTKTSRNINKKDYHPRIDLAKKNADELSAKIYEIILEIDSLE